MNHSIRVSTNAAKWTLIAVWSNRILGLLSTLVLVKLLTPYDFGVSITAVMVQSLAQSFTEIGYKQYIIKNNLRDHTSISSAWTLSLYFKSSSVFIILILAYVSRYYFNNVDVSNVLLASTLIPIMSGLVNPGLVLDEMNDNYKIISLIPVFSKIITVPITIILAVLYQSFWAVVISGLIGAIVSVLLSYVLNQYRPSLSHEGFRAQLSFSKNIFLYSILGFMRSRLENFMILHLFGVKGNGTYSVTQEFGYLPLTEIAMPLSRGFYASAALLKTNEERIQLLSKYTNIGFLILVPCVFGSLAIAELFAEVVMGKQWVEYAHLITLFSVISVQFYTINLVSNLFVINENFRFVYAIDVLYISTLAISSYVVGFTDIELFTVARALIAYGILLFAFVVLSKITNTKMLQTLMSLPVISACSFVMYISVESLLVFLNNHGIHSLTSFLILISFGAAIYLISMFVASKFLAKRITQMHDIQLIFEKGFGILASIYLKSKN